VSAEGFEPSYCFSVGLARTATETASSIYRREITTLQQLS